MIATNNFLVNHQDGRPLHVLNTPFEIRFKLELWLKYFFLRRYYPIQMFMVLLTIVIN